MASSSRSLRRRGASGRRGGGRGAGPRPSPRPVTLLLTLRRQRGALGSISHPNQRVVFYRQFVTRQGASRQCASTVTHCGLDRFGLHFSSTARALINCLRRSTGCSFCKVGIAQTSRRSDPWLNIFEALSNVVVVFVSDRFVEISLLREQQRHQSVKDEEDSGGPEEGVPEPQRAR